MSHDGQKKTAIDDIVQGHFPDFSWPLAIARNWVRSSDEDRRLLAPNLLRRLGEKYPHALQFGVEEVLALIECGNLEEAERVLSQLEPEFGSPDEETLCRWGRLYKERGDEHLREDPDDPDRRKLAAEFYSKAAGRYEQAYEIRNGHYPGINQATLLLILASLVEPQREQHLQDCRQLANHLLDNRRSWPKTLPDDNIWHLATAGEAYLLVGKWNEAAHRYRLAQREPNRKPFHQGSMRKQVERILDTYRRSGVDDFGPFNRLDDVFPEETGDEPAPQEVEMVEQG